MILVLLSYAAAEMQSAAKAINIGANLTPNNMLFFFIMQPPYSIGAEIADEIYGV